MAHSAFWFKHDTNAKDDYKIMLLMDQLGLEGYGIYWVLIEVLREQPDYRYPMDMLPILAKRYSSSTEKFKTVVMSYGLFIVFDDENFASPSLLRRMAEYDQVIEKKRLSGSVGGKKRAINQANAKQMLSKCQASAKQVPSKCEANGQANPSDRIRLDKNRIENTLMCDRAAEIYQQYPKRVGGKVAIDSIMKALGKVEYEELLLKVKAFSSSCAGKDKKYIPLPSTWFNQERWNDEVINENSDTDWSHMTDAEWYKYYDQFRYRINCPTLNGVPMDREQQEENLRDNWHKVSGRWN